MNHPKICFELRKIKLPLERIFPVRQIKDPEKTVTRYKTILSSIKEVGLVETLMVYPQKDKPDTYLLMDGHYRYFALKSLGQKTAECIVANDDESFTFNARISRLAPIQEHKMIMKAVQNGVAPERIAAALRIRVKDVQASLSLLDGIHEEAADLLKDKPITAKAIRLLKRVTGVRQIEMADLMVSMNNYTQGYAEALFLNTSKDQLLEPEKSKEREGLSKESAARITQEMQVLQADFTTTSARYGENVLYYTSCAASSNGSWKTQGSSASYMLSRRILWLSLRPSWQRRHCRSSS
jgi:hypothetical protein